MAVLAISVALMRAGCAYFLSVVLCPEVKGFGASGAEFFQQPTRWMASEVTTTHKPGGAHCRTGCNILQLLPAVASHNFLP